jgi:DNA invertase Pin-like site-specific DNA recombinase
MMKKRGRPKADHPDGWEQYGRQKRTAAFRGIEWQITFDEWWAWWQEDSRWQRRGAERDQLCMARIGDSGPYAIGNIYCTTKSENMRDAWGNGRCDGKVGCPHKLSNHDVEQAKAMLAEGSPFKEVAKRVGVNRDTLRRYLPDGGGALRVAKGRGGRRKKLSDQDIERAKALLADEKIPVSDIAKRFGINRDTFYSYFPGGRAAYQAEKRS